MLLERRADSLAAALLPQRKSVDFGLGQCCTTEEERRAIGFLPDRLDTEAQKPTTRSACRATMRWQSGKTETFSRALTSDGHLEGVIGAAVEPNVILPAA